MEERVKEVNIEEVEKISDSVDIDTKNNSKSDSINNKDKIDVGEQKVDNVKINNYNDNNNNNDIYLGKKSDDKEITTEKTKNNNNNRNIKGKIINLFKDKYNIAFIIILVIAFLIRLKYIGQESIWNDAAVHLWYSINVIQEPLSLFSQQYLMGDYATVQTIVAFFYLFTKDAFLAGKIVAMLYFIIGTIFMYLLGKELHSKLSGVIAATLLSFNHIFWFYSVRPLADSPLLVTTIILLYFMVKLEKEKKVLWGILSGLMFLVAMFTKVQSALFVFALILYYVIFKRSKMIKDKSILISWIIPVGFILIAHILGKLLFGAAVLDRIFGLFLTTRGMPYGLEALGMLQWIFTWYLIPFIVIGILLMILYKKKTYYFSLILLIFYWIFFEINVDNTQDRYMLPLLSIGVIFAAFAIEEISSYISLLSRKKILKVVFVTVITIFLCWNFYTIGDSLVYNKSFSYVGHTEAGEWLKDNVPEDTPIFAGSPRMIRAFAEIDFGGPGKWDYGGNLWYLRADEYLESKETFEEDLQTLSQESDVYLEIDVWEYTQPSWYFPITEDSLNYFTNLGFSLVHVVEREIYTGQGLQQVPVIFILKKDKTV